jgi:hypothetical protein
MVENDNETTVETTPEPRLEARNQTKYEVAKVRPSSGYKSQSVGVVILTHNTGNATGFMGSGPMFEQCLDSLNWADRICVVDSGSTDGTLALAEKYTDHVYAVPDMSVDARLKFGIKQLNTHWVLWLEPYQAVEELLWHEIEGKLMNSDIEAVAFDMPRKLMLPSGRLQGGAAAGQSSQWIRHGGWYPRRQTRFFRPEHVAIENIGGQARIGAQGKVGQLTHALLESPVTDLRELMTWFDRQSKQGAYAYLEEGKPPDSNWITLIPRFEWQVVRRFVCQGGFKDGAAGLALSIGVGFSSIMKHLKLAELRG